MEQKLLTTIEQDIQELRILMDSYSIRPDQALNAPLLRCAGLLKEHAEQLSGELDARLRPSVEEISRGEEPAVGNQRIPSASRNGNLRKSISLNDSFRFTHELFGGNSSLMNRVVDQLAETPSFEEACSLLAARTSADEDNEARMDFMELLKKYFNQSA